ncbi:MAG: DNA glycosylase AlkZ-like family protein, partial [Acidimicrobiales bacterium]
IVLEYLFRCGRVASRRDSRFQRHFDLPERIIPSEVLALPTPTTHEAQRELLLIATKAHGIGSLDCLSDYHRMGTKQARPRLAELVEDGQVLQIQVEGWGEPAYLHPDAKKPRRVAACTMVSPFDPVVWNRRRAKLLFDFDYRIEIYVPQPKREFGYYVLPFLLGEELVGRIEVKADRKDAVLRVFGAWSEPHHENEFTAAAMASSIRELAKHLQMNDFEMPHKGNLSALVTAQLG